jgi:uncharacterized protein YodC (DUF2158 family)
MDEIKKGDVVVAKTGVGPKMVAVEVGDYELIDDGVKCRWFEGGKPMEKVFERCFLQKPPDPPLPV